MSELSIKSITPNSDSFTTKLLSEYTLKCPTGYINNIINIKGVGFLSLQNKIFYICITLKQNDISFSDKELNILYNRNTISIINDNEIEFNYNIYYSILPNTIKIGYINIFLDGKYIPAENNKYVYCIIS